MKNENYRQAAEAIRSSPYTIAFTGAGISVESGIPPFRGGDGLWSKYDPEILDLQYFYKHPEKSWPVIKEIFYDFFGNAHPNIAHLSLAKLEAIGKLQGIITQNIDNLHQEAGSKLVHEFHGTCGRIVCTKCQTMYPSKNISLAVMPPACPSCGGLLKPDFVFFGENIPTKTYHASFEAAERAKVVLVIGTTGEVMPAGSIPIIAKQKGACIIEINTETSAFTTRYTDYFLQGKATQSMQLLMELIDI
jgi:NAD-dependent deacetylase